jgi:uncharacterized LabA/DUF88 family protein
LEFRVNERTAIFIDGAYLQRVLRDEFGGVNVNFDALSWKMANETDILRTYYYNCMPYQGNPPTQEESRRFGRARGFHTALQMLPRFEVKLGRLEFRGNDDSGNPILQQKRVDILLGVDMVLLSAKGHIQQAILLAGDSDFIPAVTVAKSEGVVIRLYHGDHCHLDLQREVDERIRLDQAFIDAVHRQ